MAMSLQMDTFKKDIHVKNKELVLLFKSLIGHLNNCAPYQEIRGKIPLGISTAYYILIQCFSNHEVQPIRWSWNQFIELIIITKKCNRIKQKIEHTTITYVSTVFWNFCFSCAYLSNPFNLSFKKCQNHLSQDTLKKVVFVHNLVTHLLVCVCVLVA